MREAATSALEVICLAAIIAGTAELLGWAAAAIVGGTLGLVGSFLVNR